MKLESLIGLDGVLLLLYAWPAAKAIEYKNIALEKPTKQIDTWQDAVSSRAVDGNPAGEVKYLSCSVTKAKMNNWWIVDLLIPSSVYAVRIKNREVSYRKNLRKFYVYVSLFNPLPLPSNQSDFLGDICLFRSDYIPGKGLHLLPCTNDKPLRGRFVYIWKPGESGGLHLCELEVLTDASYREFSYSVIKGFKSSALPSYTFSSTVRTSSRCAVACLNERNITSYVMQFDMRTGICSCFESSPFEDITFFDILDPDEDYCIITYDL